MAVLGQPGEASAPIASMEVGDLALYRPSHGRGGAVLCRVLGFGVEAGRLVIDNDLGHWGYASQYAPAPQERAAVASEGCAA